MIVPDINLILYAEIAAFDQHKRARQWWEQSINGERNIGLCAPVLFGFIRISTNRKVFKEPLSTSAALSRATHWLDHPNVRYLTPGSQHVSLAFTLLEQIGTAANLTTDTQIAAYALEHGAEVHSNDHDFARFDGLKFHNPLN